MASKVIAPVFLCFILAVGGCGSDGGDTASSTAIAGQVKRYYAALESGDGKVACRLLTDQAARSFEAVLTGRVSRDCETNIETLSRTSGLGGIPQVTRVQSTANQATAHVMFEDPPLESDVVLAREGRTWRLSQLPATVESGSAATAR
jgi:hypothetical protein